MPSTHRSKRSLPSSSSASLDKSAAELRLEALLRERLGSEIARVASVVLEILLKEGWMPPQRIPSSAAPGELPSATKLFDAARAGGIESVRSLIDLPTDALRRLIGELGYDPARRARKWRDRERLIAFIADETVKRVRRNRAFLSGTESDQARVESAPTATEEPSREDATSAATGEMEGPVERAPSSSEPRQRADKKT